MNEKKSVLSKIITVLVVIVVVLLAILLIARYGDFETGTAEYPLWNMNNSVSPDYAADETPDETTGEAAEHVPAPEETPTVLEAYAAVIGEYYTVLQEDWDAAQVMEAGLNYMVADSFFETPTEDIGYAVEDLDGDGTEELIIGSRREDDFYGKLIFSLYTLDSSGAPQLLFDSTERDRYYYAGGIRFANLGSSDWNDSFVTTLKLQDKEMIDMTYTTEPEDYVQMNLTPFSQWVR